MMERLRPLDTKPEGSLVVVIFEVISSQQSAIIRYYIGVWRVSNQSHAF